MATVMKNENPRLFWPGNNYSLTPAEAYISQALFDEEQEKVFRGPT
jgi:hypothetical protein